MRAKDKIVLRIGIYQLCCRVGSDKYIGILSAVRSINQDGKIESRYISQVIDNGFVGVPVSCQSSSGSDLKISGKADRLESKSSSGSSIDASDLLVANAFADSSSGSSIDVNATETLTAEASSGSSVTYEHEPKRLNKKTRSGGSVSIE